MSRPVGGGFPDIPDCDPDFAAGDLVACSMRSRTKVMLNPGSADRARRHGRFVRKGSDDEHFLLDCGLTYRRLDVDRVASASWALSPGSSDEPRALNSPVRAGAVAGRLAAAGAPVGLLVEIKLLRYRFELRRFLRG